jgi:hypothetical protein
VRKEREIFINLDQNEEGDPVQLLSPSRSRCFLPRSTTATEGTRPLGSPEAGAKHGRAEGPPQLEVVEDLVLAKVLVTEPEFFPRVLRPVTVAEIYRLVTEVI